MESPAHGYLRIGELSRRVGVSPELLRAWERRYGLICPSRTTGGFRLYSDDDVARVRAMVEHLAHGLSAAQAAQIALSGAERSLAATLAPADRALARSELLAAIESFDDAGAQASFDRLLGGLTMESVIVDVLLPVLREVGERWSQDELTIAQEHFASNLIRGRLLGLARGWGRGVGPLAVLACPPGEQHDLPLICLGLSLRAHGWRVTFLGQDTPLATIMDAVRELEPTAVVVSATLAERLEPLYDELTELCTLTRVAIGGPGATPELALRSGAELLRGDPTEAAAQLAGTA